MTTVPPGRTSSTASDHACSVPAASSTTSAPRPSPGLGTERAPRAPAAPRGRRRSPASRRRRRRRPRASARSARRRGPRRSHPPRSPARSTPRRQQASGSSSAATSGAETGRDGVEIDRRDALGHDDPVRVRTGQELRAPALPASRAAVAGTARRRVGGDHSAPVDEPAELVPERRGRLAQQDGVPAAIGLQIGAVGQRDLDLHEHLAGTSPRACGTSSIRRSPGAYSLAAFTA